MIGLNFEGREISNIHLTENGTHICEGDDEHIIVGQEKGYLCVISFQNKELIRV